MSDSVSKAFEKAEILGRPTIENELSAILNLSKYVREELLRLAPNCVPFSSFLIEGLALELLLRKRPKAS